MEHHAGIPFVCIDSHPPAPRSPRLAVLAIVATRCGVRGTGGIESLTIARGLRDRMPWRAVFLCLPMATDKTEVLPCPPPDP